MPALIIHKTNFVLTGICRKRQYLLPQKSSKDVESMFLTSHYTMPYFKVFAQIRAKRAINQHNLSSDTLQPMRKAIVQYIEAHRFCI